MSDHQTVTGTLTASGATSAVFYLRPDEVVAVTATFTGTGKVSLSQVLGQPAQAYRPLIAWTTSQSAAEWRNTTNQDLYLVLRADRLDAGASVAYTLADVEGDQILAEWYTADGTLVARITDQGLQAPVALTGDVTGNADTATALETARTINGVAFDGTANINVPIGVGAGTGDVAGPVSSTDTAVAVFNGTTGKALSDSPLTVSGSTITGNVTGNAGTATALATARTINGVSFNGTANITVAAAAGTLTGGTLAAGVTASSLTSVGTLTSLAVTGGITGATLALSSNLTLTGSGGKYIAFTRNDGVANIGGIGWHTDTAFYVGGHPLLSGTAGSIVRVYGFSGDLRLGTNAAGDVLTITSAGATSITGTTTLAAAKVTNLAGTGTRAVGADADGNLSVGTLTTLQVGNLNLNGNTLSSTAGTDLLITPLAGQQIVLDGTIVVDAGVVTGATSITSTAFIGALTGNASTATSATNIGVTDAGGDTQTYVLLANTQTGTQAARTDASLTYNASTNTLSATFVSASSGLIGTVNTAAQPNITSVGTLTTLSVDNLTVNGNAISSSSGDITITPASGNQIVLDGTIQVDAGIVTGVTELTASQATVSNFTASLGASHGTFTGAVLNTTATRAATTSFRHYLAQSNNVAVFTIYGDGSTLQAQGLTVSAGGITVTGNSTVTGTLTATAFSGAVTGAVTGDVTGNASTATALQSSRTIFGISFNGTANVAGALTGATTGAFSGVVTASDFELS